MDPFSTPAELENGGAVIYGFADFEDTYGPPITFASMFNHPARVERAIADLTQQHFIASRLFPESLHATGPALDLNAGRNITKKRRNRPRKGGPRVPVRRTYEEGRKRRMMRSAVAKNGCGCLCHQGFGGEHPNEKCACRVGPQIKLTVPVSAPSHHHVGTINGRKVYARLDGTVGLTRHCCEAGATCAPRPCPWHLRGATPRTATLIKSHTHVAGTAGQEEEVMASETRAEMLERMAETKRQTARELEQEAAWLRSMTEPVGIEDGTNVIYFEKTLNSGGKVYSYAALKTPHGWYVTGKTSPQALSWDALIQWIGPDATVWTASEFTQL